VHEEFFQGRSARGQGFSSSSQFTNPYTDVSTGWLSFDWLTLSRPAIVSNLVSVDNLMTIIENSHFMRYHVPIVLQVMSCHPGFPRDSLYHDGRPRRDGYIDTGP